MVYIISHSVVSILALNLMLGRISVGETASSINTGQSRFTQGFISESESFWSYSNVRSVVECAKMCASKEILGSSCGGFQHLSDTNSCRLYADGIDTDVTGTASISVKKEIAQEAGGQTTESALKHCPTSSGFSLVPGINGTFCLKILTGNYVIYDTAVQLCAQLGARIAHLDSSDIYNAIGTLRSRLGISVYQTLWVGASDFRSEGSWVSEFDLQPLDPYYWHWYADEPNDFMGSEDCACLRHDLTLNDEMCSLPKPPLCDFVG